MQTYRINGSKGLDELSNWVRAIGCLIMTFITLGIARSNSLLFVAIMEQTYVDRGMASWPFNIAGAAVIVVAPLAGFLGTKMTSRSICLTASLMFSVGIACCYFSNNLVSVSFFFGAVSGSGMILITSMMPAIINDNFKKHRATALGLAFAGPPLGTFAFTFIVTHILETYDLRGTFLLLGGIGLNTLVGSSLLGSGRGPIPSVKVASTKTITESVEINVIQPANFVNEVHSNPAFEFDQDHQADSKSNNVGENPPKSQEKFSTLMLLRLVITTPCFYLIALTRIALMNVMGTFVLVMVDYMKDKGMHEDRAYMILLVFSGGEIVGQLGLGWITDRKLLSRQTYIAVLMGVSGCALLLLTFSVKTELLMCLIAVVGVTQGTINSITIVIINDYMRKEAVTLAFGLARSATGLITLCRAPILEYFRDTHGSYDTLFQIFGALMGTSSVLWFIERVIFKLNQRKKQDERKDVSS